MVIVRMKKGLKIFFIFLVISLLFSSQLPASQSSQKQGTLELYYGNYQINEPRFKDVYEKGGAIWGIALSCSLIFGFDFYTEIKRFYKLGLLTYTKEESKFLLLPISFGIRYVLAGKALSPYLGGGKDIYFYYENNPIGTVFDFADGYHVLGGVYLRLGEDFPVLLNLKIKYTQVKAKENDLNTELGGIEYGGALVITF